MIGKKLQKLIETSRNNSAFFERFLKREEYDFNKGLIWKVWFMPEELISIYWTDEYNQLTLKQKKFLSYLEACHIIYIYAFTEAAMCLFLARDIFNYSFNSLRYKFILREQIEEYRHQDMFNRALDFMNYEVKELNYIWKNFIKFQALYVPRKFFYVMQVVVEIISWDFGKEAIKNLDIYPLIRDLAQIHEIEETRHIEFAHIQLDDFFSKSNIFTRTLAGWFVIFDVMFINSHYINYDNFKKLNVKNPKKLYKLAKLMWKKNNLKNFNSLRGKKFLKRYKFITPLNRWGFKKFLGFTDL